jgi:hypothetical protein
MEHWVDYIYVKIALHHVLVTPPWEKGKWEGEKYSQDHNMSGGQ